MDKEQDKQIKDNPKIQPKKLSLRSILGGDILANDFLRRQAKLIILIMILTVLYIDNRYSAQQDLIEIDKLKKELTDIKYDALTRSSELMEKSRQSKIEEYVSSEGSELQTATSRPYLLKKKD
ncbi:MAG: FtsL-like putative cell division protein [Phocaeicola sp.]|uniref:FtsL-like putative cell division protein n=1 Tax=Phocaeicola sp. TaxID=2773926 RepID=UPI003FA11779